MWWGSPWWAATLGPYFHITPSLFCLLCGPAGDPMLPPRNQGKLGESHSLEVSHVASSQKELGVRQERTLTQLAQVRKGAWVLLGTGGHPGPVSPGPV